MRATCKKRANLARRQRVVRTRIFLMALSLALGASAIGETCGLGVQCSSEAKVSLERNGPQGTIAEDRPAVGQAGSPTGPQDSGNAHSPSSNPKGDRQSVAGHPAKRQNVKIYPNEEGN